MIWDQAILAVFAWSGSGGGLIVKNGKCASDEVIFGTGYVQPSHVFLLFKVVFQHI